MVGFAPARGLLLLSTMLLLILIDAFTKIAPPESIVSVFAAVRVWLAGVSVDVVEILFKIDEFTAIESVACRMTLPCDSPNVITSGATVTVAPGLVAKRISYGAGPGLKGDVTIAVS